MPLAPAAFLDAILDLPRPMAERVSPDLAWIAWTWFGRGRAADVYVAPTDGSAAPVRLTDTAQDSMVVSWGPDSRTLIVAEDQDGDERVRLYAVDRTRPFARTLLTDAEPRYFLRGGRLHPNGRWLIYAANWDGEREIEAHCIWRQDIVSGERRILARPHRPAGASPLLNDQGTLILQHRKDRRPSGTQVWLVDIEGRDAREIVTAGDALKAHASWLPDGQRAVVVAETGTHDRVGVWDARDGSLRWLIDDPARAIEDARAARGCPLIVVEETRDARLRTSLLDPETGLETPVAVSSGSLSPLARLPDGAWIGSRYAATAPRDLVRFDLTATGPEHFHSLTRLAEATALTASDLAPAEDFRWTAPDGLPIQGWLYRAEAPALGTVLHVHGGPTAHSEDRLTALVQYLVRRGFNVLEPNYRGSTGFGLAFREAIKAEGWGGMEQADITAGIDALIAAGIARPGTVGITGTSYGGYSAWCAITREPRWRVAAAAPICGMTDLVVDYETTRPDIRPYSEEMMGGTPAEAPQRYRDRSPIHFVDHIRGDLLIVQGMRDPNVTPDNVTAVTAALDRAAIPYRVLAFADEGHGIRKPANQRTLYPALAEFFAGAFAKAERSN